MAAKWTTPDVEIATLLPSFSRLNRVFIVGSNPAAGLPNAG
jgi:hypothetical protein